jgi:pyruvate dehydrogenase E2 component (dihydrolipoamide acetyltransferase)
MAQYFVMPQASPTMTVGVVAKWLLTEGAVIEPGTAIAQVETDKATMDIEVFDRSVLLRILAAAGEEVPPGRPIAIVGAAGEDVTALVAEFEASKAGGMPAAPAPAPTDPAVVQSTPPPAPAPPVALTIGASPLPSPAEPAWAGRPVDPSIMEPRPALRAPERPVIASPLARALAAERGVDLRRVTPSGPGGRIVAADLDSAGPTAAAPADEAARVTQMRKTIARRLTEVHQQVPVFYLTISLDAAPLVRLKDALDARATKVSVNDLLMKAVAWALREVPACNAQWQGDTILRRGAVDIGVAVALPEGLVTPVVRGVDRLGVAAVSRTVRELAERAKAGKLAPEDYTGGSFTISNLGMFGIEQFTAILNPPEAAILAVGAAQQVPVVEDGAVRAGWRMKVTMTCDHRVIDGALGARFLQALRAVVENPGLLGV